MTLISEHIYFQGQMLPDIDTSSYLNMSISMPVLISTAPSDLCLMVGENSIIMRGGVGDAIAVDYLPVLLSAAWDVFRYDGLVFRIAGDAGDEKASHFFMYEMDSQIKIVRYYHTSLRQTVMDEYDSSLQEKERVIVEIINQQRAINNSHKQKG